MKVVYADILNYNELNDSFNVTYALNVKPGVIRRTTATFKDGNLSRDNDNNKLKEFIKQKTKIFRRKNKEY